MVPLNEFVSSREETPRGYHTGCDAGVDSPDEIYRQERIALWDQNARGPTFLGWMYARRLQEIYRFLVPRGLRILEIGSGRGDLLASLEPVAGVGIDFSPKMVQAARARHPQLRFLQADGHQLPVTGPFDVIIASDLLNDLWDVQKALEEIRRVCKPHTRLILNFYNRLWQPLLKCSQRLGLARPTLPQNWLGFEDVANLLRLTDFEVVRHWEEILCPLPIPLLHQLSNRFLAKTWPFHALDLAQFVVARPVLRPPERAVGETVSIIVPARNEAGNIPAIFASMPRIGRETELIFVEGHSRDDTYETIAREMTARPEWRCKLFRQTGVGKGDAVRLGIAHAEGDVIMILDADLTVSPAELLRFYDALRRGHGELINGVRLIYPMEKKAMRFLNFLANKFFSKAFTWLLGQPIKDTLCGTKAFSRQHYLLLAGQRGYFGDFDPFGDFDLLFGAAKINMKIVDLPIHYRERSYGTTNISRWKHGWLLLRMLTKAAQKLKFF